MVKSGWEGDKNCVCSHGCGSTCACESMCVCGVCLAYMYASMWRQVNLRCLSSCLLRRGLSLTWNRRLAREWEGSLCLHLVKVGAKSMYFHTWLFKCGFWGSNPDPCVCTASTLSTQQAPRPTRNPLRQNPPLPSELNSFAISHDLYHGPSPALKQWDCLDALYLINGLTPPKLWAKSTFLLYKAIVLCNLLHG